MSGALKGVPVSEASPPEGVKQLGGEWYYVEYAAGGGVTSLGLDEAPAMPTSEDDKRGILDLFRR
jgi:penicillin-binding protein 1A